MRIRENTYQRNVMYVFILYSAPFGILVLKVARCSFQLVNCIYAPHNDSDTFRKNLCSTLITFINSMTY